MMLRHVLKSSVCAVAIVMGFTVSHAGSLETINVGRVGSADGSGFVGRSREFALLPYQMGSRVSRGHHEKHDDNEAEGRVADARAGNGSGSSGLFDGYDVLPHSKALNINSICYQRELGGATVLDSAESAADLGGQGFGADGTTTPAVITVSLGDASVATLAAVSVDELQDTSADESTAGATDLPADATPEQIVENDAAAEADMQALQDESASNSDGATGETDVAALDPSEAPNIDGGSVGGDTGDGQGSGDGTVSDAGGGTDDGSSANGNGVDGGVDDGTVDQGSGDAGGSDGSGDPVIVGELPDDLGAPPSVDISPEPVSLDPVGGGANGGADVPIPAAFPLLASVLAGFGVMSVRRSRRQN
jgi:hypothetical protein